MTERPKTAITPPCPPYLSTRPDYQRERPSAPLCAYSLSGKLSGESRSSPMIRHRWFLAHTSVSHHYARSHPRGLPRIMKQGSYPNKSLYGLALILNHRRGRCLEFSGHYILLYTYPLETNMYIPRSDTRLLSPSPIIWL